MSDDVWVTEHFRWQEFSCHDGTEVPGRFKNNIRMLAERLEVIRAACGGAPMTILSGYRTPAWNKKVGGAENSMHKAGKAADVVVAGVSPAEVRKVIEDLIRAGKLANGGVGAYAKFTHVDCGRPRRWKG